MPAVNALLLGSLLYRSGLVPRILPLLGLVGAPLLRRVQRRHGARPLGTGVPASAAVAALPIAAWELSLGVYLIVKGFRPSPLTAGTRPRGLAR